MPQLDYYDDAGPFSERSWEYLMQREGRMQPVLELRTLLGAASDELSALRENLREVESAQRAFNESLSAVRPLESWYTHHLTQATRPYSDSEPESNILAEEVSHPVCRVPLDTSAYGRFLPEPYPAQIERTRNDDDNEGNENVPRTEIQIAGIDLGNEDTNRVSPYTNYTFTTQTYRYRLLHPNVLEPYSREMDSRMDDQYNTRSWFGGFKTGDLVNVHYNEAFVESDRDRNATVIERCLGTHPTTGQRETFYLVLLHRDFGLSGGVIAALVHETEISLVHRPASKGR